MDQIRVAAETERLVLLQQAMREHEERVQTEMRRFRSEVSHIQDVYQLRLSALAG